MRYTLNKYFDRGIETKSAHTQLQRKKRRKEF